MRDFTAQREIGIVRATKHYLASIEGLPSACVHDLVRDEDGGRALVTALSHDAVEVMVLDSHDVRPGQRYELVSRDKQFAVGDFLLGRVVNALGDPIDEKGGFPQKNAPLVLERDAGDLADRAPIAKQFVTGFSLVDTVLPIGMGQRQLIMGPVQSGTDVFCREVIRNQRGTGTVCIYATLGKSHAHVRRLVDAILSEESAAYTMVLACTSDDPAPQIAIAPSVALYIAEYFSGKGHDVLVVLDDLYTQAKYLREIALLGGRLPGRDSYPGDIFYQQAHLIERAGSFEGRGSITLLPVLQTDLESYTDLITTNVMGTTDGHMSFSTTLFAQGVFPSVVAEESVTRVGKHTQTIVQKQLSTAVTSLLAEAREQLRFTQFGAQVSDLARNTILMGDNLRALLNQDGSERFDVSTQAILLAIVFTRYGTERDAAYFRKNRSQLAKIIAEHQELAELRNQVSSEKSLEQFLHWVEQHVPLLFSTCHT